MGLGIEYFRIKKHLFSLAISFYLRDSYFTIATLDLGYNLKQASP